MNWDAVKKEWETSKITLKDLAAKHDIKLGTLKSRKSREGWSRDATKGKKVATKKKVGGQPGNKGNPNPTPKFAKRNSSAVTHGLFAKYLPDETMEIMNGINDISPIEILWMNIQMQFASIMRAQQIMFVQDKYDDTKETKKTASGEGFDSTEYEIQFAWDKQATFLNSQSRAMGELRSMLKQFAKMAHDDDYRLLELERMRVSIDKVKAEADRLSRENTNDDDDEIIIVDSWGASNE
ncbi:phage terminase small subunit [Microbulbifer pacificus]|uniref:phage terminase small subunit n=1 Tax=Microbulbifer pacificus TaxID=407164 RepID=UPI000CF4108F|nr:phage terminase small subunit [Microbulbifer pacificus]